MSVYQASVCRPTPTAGLRVYPPGQTAALFVASPGRGCANPNVDSSMLRVGPVVPGPADGGTGATP